MTYAPDLFAAKTVLVTGGSSGIGLAIATRVAELGGRTILVGRDAARLETAVAALPGEGHRTIACDVADFDAAAAMLADEAEAAGGLDGVVHAAGVELVQAARLMKAKSVTDVLGATLFGGLGLAKSAGKIGVMKSPSSIVMLSSVAAQRGKAGMVLYSTAKASVEGLVRSLAAELAPKGVRVNALAAGAVETPMHARITRAMPADAVTAYAAAHPLGFGRPNDLASAAAYLLSDASRWVTGTTHVVDGGYTAI